MKLDESGYKALHNREGLRTKPYLDTKGIPTIAMGNTFYLDGKKVTMQDKPLTLLQAKELGKIISDNFAKQVADLITSNVNQNQFNACVSLAYNIGINGFTNSTALRMINKNPDNPGIGSAFMMWTKDKELIGRRESEVKQYYSL